MQVVAIGDMRGGGGHVGWGRYQIQSEAITADQSKAITIIQRQADAITTDQGLPEPIAVTQGPSMLRRDGHAIGRGWAAAVKGGSRE